MNPRKPQSKKNNCEKMRDKWLDCRNKYKGASAFSKGSDLCNTKFKDYLYKCGEKERKKRLICSIYATH